MRRELLLAAALVAGGVAVAAQQAGAPKPAAAKKGPMSDAAKVQMAVSAAPADIAKGAAVMDMDEKGAMKQLRAGSNGWTCMLIPAGDEPEAMCMDKAWSGWADAYMTKKTPPTPKTLGVAYMLRGDHGASNTDPFATKPTASNQWVVSPSHVMLLVPDAKMLDTMPTDPHSGGPWVMWKGTPYAHIMVPMAAVPTTK
jgi:hypothetical protein